MASAATVGFAAATAAADVSPAPLASADRAPTSAPPLVSVVVPTCGRPALLARCLDALLRQDFGGAYEVIVVDDAQHETTRVQVAQRARTAPAHAALHYLRPPTGRGPAVARNAGWRAARGELIAFTDDDTVPALDWLAHGARAMRAGDASSSGSNSNDNSNRIAALAGRVVVPPAAGRGDGTNDGTSDGNRNGSGAGHVDKHAAGQADTQADAHAVDSDRQRRRPTDHELMTRGLESAEFVTANAFVWRDALVRVDGFDERFRRAWREDSDLQFRLQAQVGAVGRCAEAVVLHPVRPERWGVSLRQQKNVFYDALLYRKHPRLYRERIHRAPPWDYFVIVGASLLAALAQIALAGTAWLPAWWPGGVAQSATEAGPHGVWLTAASAALGALALVLVLRFAARRLRTTARDAGHVAEMLATSAVIPFLSVYWRLRGALHFRVWFL